MDHSLMQLERELFSLSPVEPERRLCLRLEQHVCRPAAQIQRRISQPAAVLPFQWKRVVVPAAAAVAVVAVMSSTENISSRTASQRAPLMTGNHRITPVKTPEGSLSGVSPVTLMEAGRETRDPGSSGYSLVNTMIDNIDWEPVEHHFWLSPEAGNSIQLSVPKPKSAGVSLRFY